MSVIQGILTFFFFWPTGQHDLILFPEKSHCCIETAAYFQRMPAVALKTTESKFILLTRKYWIFVKLL